MIRGSSLDSLQGEGLGGIRHHLLLGDEAGNLPGALGETAGTPVRRGWELAAQGGPETAELPGE